MHSLGLEVRPVDGAAVQNLMREIHASPPEVLKLAREILVETPPAPRDLRHATAMIRDRGGRPGKSDPRARQEAAAALAIAALGFLAGDPEHLERFLALTGISPGDIRTAAREPDFLAGVLDYVAGNEALAARRRGPCERRPGRARQGATGAVRRRLATRRAVIAAGAAFGR